MFLTGVLNGCFPIYGNFCGAGYPNIENEDKNLLISEFQKAPVKQLKNGTPDFIDSACKKHDICYIKEGNFARQCDVELESTLMNAITIDYRPGSTATFSRCDRIAADILDYFYFTPIKNYGSPFVNILMGIAYIPSFITMPVFKLVLEAHAYVFFDYDEAPERFVDAWPNKEDVCLTPINALMNIQTIPPNYFNSK